MSQRGPGSGGYEEKDAMNGNESKGHNVTITAQDRRDGALPTCSVEIDGMKIRGIKAVRFEMGEDRIPLLTLTIGPGQLDMQGTIPHINVEADQFRERIQGVLTQQQEEQARLLKELLNLRDAVESMKNEKSERATLCDQCGQQLTDSCVRLRDERGSRVFVHESCFAAWKRNKYR